MKVKRGFTILELLVASLLLGMLMTVLTMIFNQSSISWRVGTASIADIDMVSDGISSVHDVADNLYTWNGKPYLLTSVWEEKNPQDNTSSTLRQNRPIAAEDGSTGTAGQPSKITDEGRSSAQGGSSTYSFVPMFKAIGTSVAGSSNPNPGKWENQSVGEAKTDSDNNKAKLYTVNVKSAGPDRKFDTYDDIWSFPDDFY